MASPLWQGLVAELLLLRTRADQVFPVLLFPPRFTARFKQAAIDWWENLDVQREMRRDIKRLLRRTNRYEEDELDELVRQVVEVARRRLA